ncbi:MAG: DUF3793 family protein [Clostridiales bacterium]|nr:DUF3793 family protein [Clostridiales bacterium]
MPVETMLSFLEHCTPEARLGFRVVAQCAPVLKGIKISNLISLEPGGWLQIREYLSRSEIVCVFLYMDGEREIVFLYRPRDLALHLERTDVRDFLRQYGYENLDIASVLKRLRERYRQYAMGETEFPHELGVLLEYPVRDVEGFIENEGRNCLLSRYWKVYHDPKEAESKFRAYDRAKEQAMTEIINGWPLGRIAVSQSAASMI